MLFLGWKLKHQEPPHSPPPWIWIVVASRESSLVFVHLFRSLWRPPLCRVALGSLPSGHRHCPGHCWENSLELEPNRTACLELSW
jgi:hypothetical protein